MQRLKKYAGSTALCVLTVFNTIVFLVSRNEFWINHPGQAWLAASQTQDRTYITSEFARNLTCYQALTCLRSGSAFIFESGIWIVEKMTEISTVDLNNSQRVFIILQAGTLWRLSTLLIFYLSLNQMLKNRTYTFLLTNGLLVVLSGLPLWAFGRLITHLPFGFSSATLSRAHEAFFHMSYQDLIFYDYGFIALIPLAMLVLASQKDFTQASAPALVSIGFVLATFYEAFVPLVFLSGILFYFSEKRKISFNLLWLLFGQVIWTICRAFSFRFLGPVDPESTVFRDTSVRSVLYSFTSKGLASTKNSLPSIAIQLILVSVVAILIGSLCALMLIRNNRYISFDRKVITAIRSVMLATTIIICGGYLTPKFVELGRQSLGLTVALVIYSFANTQNAFSRQRLTP